MKYKVKMLADRFTKLLSSWECVECVSLNEAALPATLDPYFALIIDAFCAGHVPEISAREEQYGGDIGAFETSGNKDRFLIDDIPVRIEFKSTKNIDEVVSIACENTAENDNHFWMIKDSGTYGFYRLCNGYILFSRTGWIDRVRERLRKPLDSFWTAMRQANQSKMEHFLSDLGAALIQGDEFFYLMSEAGFIKTACLTLFCINRRFEPSHRAYYRQVIELPIKNDAFYAQLETFLRNKNEVTMERRYTLAQLIARGIVTL
ncbi:MAG: DUF4037 domain-containing protein [Spirochaetaceae bacterium]|jgi:hypothetical protein|nr:DUF4037 domain-containing protein [Spirochaetaceae bacterium]